MGFWKSLGANVGTLPAHRYVKWECSERKGGSFLASSSVARVFYQCSTALEGPVAVPTRYQAGFFRVLPQSSQDLSTGVSIPDQDPLLITTSA